MKGYEKLAKKASRDLYTVVCDETAQHKSRRKRDIRKIEYAQKRFESKIKRNVLIKKIISCSLLFLVLCVVFPYSFRHYIASVFSRDVKPKLKVDYEKLLNPTYSYLYRDLFLGKYPIKFTEYSNPRMVDIKEGYERSALKSELLALASEYPAVKPAVYVWEYGSKTYVNINADEVYPSASIIKIPVLIEMLRAVDAGKFTLNDSVTLENWYRAEGSGKLQYAQGHVDYTMDYLAEIMIENSDNSATNMIISKLGGMPEVNRAMKRWGLKSTVIQNWLPDLDGTNVTTAREMAKMLYNMDVTDIISKKSKQRAGYYMSHVKNNRLIQAGLPDDALLLHKTGDIGHMLGDAGIVKAPNGKKYIVVILVRRPYNHFQGKEFIVKASKLIYNNII